MKTKTDEPLVAVILKGLSVLSLVAAVIYYVSMFFVDGPLKERPLVLAGKQALAGQLAGAAIMLWWMGEIIALLARIAANGERQAAVGKIPVGSRQRPAADDDVPRYQL